MSSETVNEKIKNLEAFLASHQHAAIAFSGGVDSTFLLAVAHAVLGDNVTALTAQSPAFPAREHAEAEEFCSSRGIRHIVFDAHQFNVEEFAKNTPKRCYYCKRALFSRMQTLAEEQHLGPIMDGSNTDDLGDFRPGTQALKELSIISPLLQCNFSKSDIREASHDLGLSSAKKPSFACLATRFPYGCPITPEGLARVDAAEQTLLNLGMNTVRVRSIDNEARIEVLPSDFDKVLQERNRIIAALQECGFTYITLDLQGYRTGSMNEVLDQ